MAKATALPDIKAAEFTHGHAMRGPEWTATIIFPRTAFVRSFPNQPVRHRRLIAARFSAKSVSSAVGDHAHTVRATMHGNAVMSDAA
jgi:hypothetical protein